jgi:hypothetical protein
VPLWLQLTVPACLAIAVLCFLRDQRANGIQRLSRWLIGQRSSRSSRSRFRLPERIRAVLELRHNQPAILRITNADDRPRVFNAPKFFPAARLGKITVDELPVAEALPRYHKDSAKKHPQYRCCSIAERTFSLRRSRYSYQFLGKRHCRYVCRGRRTCEVIAPSAEMIPVSSNTAHLAVSKTDVCETQQSPEEGTVMRRRGELARNGVA